MTPLALAFIYWLHMLATVVWLGGLAGVALIVLPAARQSLDDKVYAALLGRIQERLNWVSWVSLLVLGATGMFQMSANSHYNGFMTIDSPWASAILSKHIVVALMVLVGVYNTWGLLPALRRTALLRAAGKVVYQPEADRLERREKLLLWLNLILSALVLALTALARSV